MLEPIIYTARGTISVLDEMPSATLPAEGLSPREAARVAAHAFQEAHRVPPDSVDFGDESLLVVGVCESTGLVIFDGEGYVSDSEGVTWFADQHPAHETAARLADGDVTQTSGREELEGALASAPRGALADGGSSTLSSV